MDRPDRPLPPQTRYTRAGGYAIGYQVYGDGPYLTLLELSSHLDFKWTYPESTVGLERLAAFATVIDLDHRGFGVSDPAPDDEVVSPAALAADVLGVLDAAGAGRTAVYATGERVPDAIRFAAEHADRVERLILDSGTARIRRADDYPAGIPPAVEEALLAYIDANWGADETVAVVFPVDEARRSLMARRSRLSMAPKVASAFYRGFLDADVRDLLPRLTMPTLVMHRRSNSFIRPAHSHHLAEHIPGAELLEYDASENEIWFGEDVFAEIERFVTGRRPPPRGDRAIAAIVRTDIVASTQRTASVGDRRWRGFVDDHARIVEREADRAGGRIVRNTGDGVIATFGQVGLAVGFAKKVRDALRTVGLEVRSGVHVGEVDVLADDIAGLAVVICTRVCELAAAGEILVSSPAREIAEGSGVTFDDRGEHAMKGVPGPRRIYAVRV